MRKKWHIIEKKKKSITGPVISHQKPDARRDWNNIFKILKEKKLSTQNTVCWKVILKDWGQNKYESKTKADEDKK